MLSPSSKPLLAGLSLFLSLLLLLSYVLQGPSQGQSLLWKRLLLAQPLVLSHLRALPRLNFRLLLSPEHMFLL